MAGQTLNPLDAPSWLKFITDFDSAYRTFYDNYDAYMALGPYIQSTHPELLQDYENLLQEASDAAYKIEQLKATRDYVYSWLQWLQTGAGNIMVGAQATYDAAKRAMGFQGFNAYTSRPLDGLGVVPVAVAIVSLAAATALLFEITRIVTQFYTRAQFYNALQEQEARGSSPQEASRIVSQVMGTPTSSGANEFLGIPWTLIFWGLGALFLGPPLIDAWTAQQNRRVR